MCAVFGILGDHQPAQAKLALAKMAHRGLNYCGIIEKEKLFFTHDHVFDDTLLFRTSGEKFTDLQKNALLRRNIKDNDALRYLQLFQAEHFLSKLDRVSMAHNIESRTPYLDHRLLETVFGIDPKLRYQEGVAEAMGNLDYQG